jgi:hypothetical protein
MTEYIVAYDTDLTVKGELIRCKDCRFQNMGECEHKLGLLVANDENYCSYGEKRTDD